MTTPLQFGLDTFGDVTKDVAGAPLPHAQVIRNVIDEAVLADELGIDFIGLGEHHRADFAISSPEVALVATGIGSNLASPAHQHSGGRRQPFRSGWTVLGLYLGGASKRNS